VDIGLLKDMGCAVYSLAFCQCSPKRAFVLRMCEVTYKINTFYWYACFSCSYYDIQSRRRKTLEKHVCYGNFIAVVGGLCNKAYRNDVHGRYLPCGIAPL
jgi:hypothetical protein